MFEAACHTRIQQFDDSEESEEEEDTSTWTDKEVSFTSRLDQHRYENVLRFVSVCKCVCVCVGGGGGLCLFPQLN